MFHGNLDTDTAKGIKELRKRIDAAKIPSSRLDETIILATWNIREFGKKRRSAAAIHYIAEILGQFDLIAITELRDNLSDLKRVMAILGPYWNVVFSDFNSDARGNRERIGYLYDKRAVVFSGLAAESEPPRKKDPRNPGESIPAITWWRSPYMASFSAGNFDFILLASHIRWGSGDAARIPPLKLLASWLDKRRKEKNVYDKDWIVMGDFNIPKVNSPLFDAVTSKGLGIPAPFLDIANKKLTTNLGRNKRYDQILHYSRETFSITGKAGVLDFYNNSWQPLFPAAKYPGMTKTKFTYQLSDHLPLWVELNLRVDEEKLDQILNR